MDSILLYKHTAVVITVQFLILAFFVFQSEPLLYYDELLHAVSAQRLIQGDCVEQGCYAAATHEVLGHTFGVHRVPLFILYYVGGIKTYLFSVWFWLWGSSVISLRLFTALCGALVSGFTHYFTQRLFGLRAALVTSALLLLDPSFVLSRVLDWGPLAVQDVLKLLLFIIGFSISHTVSRRWWMACGLISGLLLWDKLNAWWFVAPVVGLLMYRDMRTIYEGRFARWLSFAGGLIVGALPVILLVWKRPWFYVESQKSFRAFEHYAFEHRDNTLVWSLLSNYVDLLDVRLKTFWDVLSGTAIPNYVLVQPIPALSAIPSLFIFAGCCLVIYLFVARAKMTRVYAEFVLVVLCVGVLIFSTPHANAIHHYLALYPFLHLIVGIVFARLWPDYRWTIALLIFIVLFNNLFILTTFFRNIDADTIKVYWRKDRMLAVTDNLRTYHPNIDVVALDWGISLPVAFLSQGSIAIKDAQPFYEAQCQKIAKRAADGSALVRYDSEFVFETYDKECRSIIFPD